MATLRIVIVLFCCGTTTLGQRLDSLLALPDSVKPFTLHEYLSIVSSTHPVASQANLLSEAARQEIRFARGNFDPRLEASLRTKKYGGEEYYSLANGSLVIPTASPISPFIGIESNTGPFLNPENYISREYNFRQVSAGVSVPIGRGLLTDERRAALKQAILFQQSNDAERAKMINKLLLDAAEVYFEWYFAFNNYRLMNRSVGIASEIYRRIKIDQQFGEAAAIDTIQAKITLQQRQLERQEAWLGLQNSVLALANALWDSTGNPISADPQWGPVMNPEHFLTSESELDGLVSTAMKDHPELRRIDAKLKHLNVEKQLAVEYLKPKLNINYYALNQPINPNFETNFDLRGSYKLGIDFSIPLFLRKERSKLALTKLKLANTNLEQAVAERTIQNELSSTYNKLLNLNSLIKTQLDIVQNYERLLTAELTNLSEGESDLFKINFQQEKLIEAQTKWLKLVTEYEKKRAYLYFSAGTNTLQ